MGKLSVIMKNLYTIPKKMFSKISIFTIIQHSNVDKNSSICMGTKFYRSDIGEYSYVGRDCFVNNTEIGKFTSIGEGCYIGGTSHPIDWVSTSPVFHKWKNVLKTNISSHSYDIFQSTKIGNDVWVGSKVLIKSGVEISNGAVIGMGSVVTKDIGPYEIWAGNPARCIKKRFEENIIDQLLEIKWWDYSEEKLVEAAKNFNDVDKFLKITDDI